jgi:two-component system NtrC family sensor kinase
VINNALAAMENGGRIEIKVREPDRDHLAFSITDTGTGISKEDLNNIFTPFFSTKGDRGTGLGLSITYGIVHKMGGDIQVESEPGQGTTFTIILPRRMEPGGDEAEAEAI